MPVVQYESNLSETTAVSRFLVECRQRAAQTDQAKIASLTFSIAPIAPWEALAALKKGGDRHFYYDPPGSAAFVGVQSVVECRAVGQSRFEAAQAFTQLWQSRFVYKSFAERPFTDPSFIDEPAWILSEPKSHFFCSATFFEQTTTDFEPICVFVPQVQVTTISSSSTVDFNCLITAQTDIDQTALQIFRQLEQLKQAGRLSRSRRLAKRRIVRNVDGFERSVAVVLKHIGQNGLHKVVLADVMDVVADVPFDGVRSLQTLRQNHPDCTVFSVGNGRGQSFIGASPERLLSIRENQITTDALAGSAPRGVTPGIDTQLAQTLLNSEKERYEHRVVVEFLLKQLRSLGLTPQCETAPQLMRLFHIQHLYTPISAPLKAHRVSPLEVLSRLHPTPAVAGVPRQQACELIRQQETFDRGLYAAPIGWIDTAGNSEFIVGIRSALIDGCSARLYAGAGIVSGSQPDKELAEIKLKLQSLLNALV
ncbi:MAG: isochorismate synthase [Leptolyngbya foveolarum]|uniref:isochorismate synthase n=1 Tax=Leptolyngbya foveolarum TaxID=47253 RepID=A0A2W4WJS5_9CYAN|nr:MAG: isochorismate synthase [Leptolyngbya foveolarum]